MNEINLISFEQTDITSWDFEQLKCELSKTLSVYNTTVYTDENIKTAKSDKATLSKAKKFVEEQRKAYKARCLAPYVEIEPKIKEIVSMIDEQCGLIDGVVKDYTNRQKAEKEKEVRKYYDKKSFVLGEYADNVYENIFDSKWLNVTTSKSRYEEEIQTAINNALKDMEEIKAFKSPFEKTLLEKYATGMSLDAVKSQNEEFLAATEKAGLNQNAQDIAPVDKQEIKTDEDEGVNVKIYASQSQLNQIFDFMKAIGVTYEVQ
jgi:hypothetical protein